MYNFSLGNSGKDPYSYDIDDYDNDDYAPPAKKGIGAFGLGKKKPFSAGLGLSQTS